jgi:hypothetical protein
VPKGLVKNWMAKTFLGRLVSFPVTVVPPGFVGLVDR